MTPGRPKCAFCHNKRHRNGVECPTKTREETPKTPKKLTVPLYALEKNAFAGLRSEMLSMGEYGGVQTGSGLGSDAIWLEWKGAYYYVRGAELLKALVRCIDPESCERFPEGIEEAKS